MDDLDQRIIRLLAKNARMPVKEIAKEVSLTSPAVSSRIHKLEQDGIIKGYTVKVNPPDSQTRVNALISISIPPAGRDEFMETLNAIPQVVQCFHVTGSYSYIWNTSSPLSRRWGRPAPRSFCPPRWTGNFIIELPASWLRPGGRGIFPSRLSSALILYEGRGKGHTIFNDQKGCYL